MNEYNEGEKMAEGKVRANMRGHEKLQTSQIKWNKTIFIQKRVLSKL